MTADFHCVHCGRKMTEDFLMMAGSVIVTVDSPLMDTPSPPALVGGCCASELGEWLQPSLLENEEYQKAKIEMLREAE